MTPEKKAREIMHQCCSGDIDSIKFLIKDKGVIKAINDMNHFSINPLISAINRDHLNIVDLLLKNNVTPNQKKSTDYTPLLHATNLNNYKIVKSLLDANANTDVLCYGYSSFMNACMFGYTDIAVMLMDYNADVTIGDERRMTGFLLACYHRKIETATTLLQCGIKLTYEENKTLVSTLYYNWNRVLDNIKEKNDRIEEIKEQDIMNSFIPVKSLILLTFEYLI
jgi:ankyrin repeat protein